MQLHASPRAAPLVDHLLMQRVAEPVPSGLRPVRPRVGRGLGTNRAASSAMALHVDAGASAVEEVDVRLVYDADLLHGIRQVGVLSKGHRAVEIFSLDMRVSVVLNVILLM